MILASSALTESCDQARPRPRPTVCLNGAAQRVGEDEHRILARIEEGSISHAWDISAGGGARRAARVLVACLDRLEGSRLEEVTDEEAELLLVPEDLERVPGPRVAWGLNCASGHVLNLVAAGELTIAAGSICRRGPGGSPAVTADSFRSFLRRRRIF